MIAYEDDWFAKIRDFLVTKTDISIAQILEFCICKPKHWTQQDRNRVGRVLRILNWRSYRSNEERRFRVSFGARDILPAKSGKRVIKDHIGVGGKTNPWLYVAKDQRIVHQRGYYVDLNRMQDSDAILDWICQVASKRWAGARDVGYLVMEINAILSPQAWACSNALVEGRRILSYSDTAIQNPVQPTP